MCKVARNSSGEELAFGFPQAGRMDWLRLEVQDWMASKPKRPTIRCPDRERECAEGQCARKADPGEPGFELLQPEEFEDEYPIPLWLRVAWRKQHPDIPLPAKNPGAAYPEVSPRPTGGWSPIRTSPGDRTRDRSAQRRKVIEPTRCVMADLRISGASANPRSESDIRLNHGDPSLVIAASNDLNATTQPQFFSTDGGATWGSTSLPAQAGDTFQSDPEVDWTSDGTAWALTLGVDAAFNSRLYSFTSTDNGATWTFETVVSGAQTGSRPRDHLGRPQPDLAVQGPGLRGLAQRHAGLRLAPHRRRGRHLVGAAAGQRRRDRDDRHRRRRQDQRERRRLRVLAGRRRQPEHRLRQVGRRRRHLQRAAGHRHDLRHHAAARDSRRQHAQACASTSRPARTGPRPRTWSTRSGPTSAATPVAPPAAAPAAAPPRPARPGSGSPARRDGGTTWSAPVKINDQAGMNDQFHSRLCVDESNGLIVVTYHDTVADAGRKQSHVYYQTSSDDGVSWSTAVQVTTSPSDATGGAVDASGFGYGDYDGLSGHYGTFFPCWTDFRNGIEEIWSSRLSLIPKQASFVMDRSSFGQDEVNAMLVQANPFVVSPAFYVVVDGFTPAELGITAGDLSGAPGTVPAFNTSIALGGITIGAPTQLVADDPALPAGVAQRFTWLYPITVTQRFRLHRAAGQRRPHRLDRRRHRQRDPRAAAGAEPLRARRRDLLALDRPARVPGQGRPVEVQRDPQRQLARRRVDLHHPGDRQPQQRQHRRRDVRRPAERPAPRGRALPDRQLGHRGLQLRRRPRPLPGAGRRRDGGAGVLPTVPGAHRLARLRPGDDLPTFSDGVLNGQKIPLLGRVEQQHPRDPLLRAPSASTRPASA